MLRKNKAACIILSLTILLSCFSGFCGMAQTGEETVLDQIELTVDFPEAGESENAGGHRIYAPEDAGYEVQSEAWDGATNLDQTYAAMDTPLAKVRIEAKEGFVFDETMDASNIIIDGAAVLNLTMYKDGKGLLLEIASNNISKVKLYISEPVIGDSVSGGEVLVGATACCRVKEVEWAGNSESIWAENEIPTVAVLLEALPGCKFSEDIKAEDIAALRHGTVTQFQLSQDQTQLSITVAMPALTQPKPIEQVEIAFPFAPRAGSTVKESGMPSVAEDAPYEILRAQWMVNGEPYLQDTWLPASKPQLYVNIIPKSGYYIEGDGGIVLGEHLPCGGRIAGIDFSDNGGISYLIEYELAPVDAEHVWIQTTIPQFGSEVQAWVNVPAGESYQLVSAQWSGAAGDQWADGEIPSLSVELEATGSYLFLQDITAEYIAVDGAQISEVVRSEDGKKLQFTATFPQIKQPVQISTISFEVPPCPKAGEEVSMSGVPTVGTEESYWISSSEWSQQEPNGSGIWEEGDIGLLTICFSSFEGYEFASQVEYQSESAEAYGVTIHMIRFGKNSYTIQIEYPPIASAETLEEIASVTVTMDEPARGEAVSKEISVADSADYTVLQYRWSGNSGSVWKSREVPKATITLQAKEGYRFGQDIARDDINAGAASISGIQVEEDGEVLSFVATFPTIASSSSTYPGGNNNRGDGIIGIIIPSVTPTPTPVPVIPTPVPTAVPSAAPQPAYPDLASVPWAQEAIGILSERGIVSGYEDNTFRPEQSITREEFVKLVVLQMYAGELDPNAVPTYLDAQNGWYSPYLALAENKGIIRGTGDGLFGVAGPITRQDMAVILYEVLKREGYQPESRKLEFTDCDEIAPYAQESVGALSGQGVIRGYEDGSFAPDAPASRAETSVILYRIMQLLEGNVE